MNRISDAGADAVVVGRIQIRGRNWGGLDQFRLGVHRPLAAQNGSHPIEQAKAGSCRFGGGFRCGFVINDRLIVIGRGPHNPAFAVTLSQIKGSLPRFASGLAEHRPDPGQRIDQTNQHEARHDRQFAPADTQNEKPKPNHHQEGQRGHDLETGSNCKRKDVEKRTKDRVAEHAAKAIALVPCGGRFMGGGIDSGKGHGNRQEDDPRQRAFSAQMGRQAHTPDQRTSRQTIGTPPDDQHQDCGKRRPEAAKQVLRNGIGRGPPARIIRRVGHQQKNQRDPGQDQGNPCRFASALFQHRLHPAVQKGISLPRLIGHLASPHP